MLEQPVRLIDENGRRLDGRGLNDLRPITLKVGLLANANGSAYIEQGKNKILAAVFGPKDVRPKHMALPDRMVIKCRYHMAPFSVEERKPPAPTRREIELSKVIRESLEPVIFSEYYPRTMIDLFIEVLQSDGGSRCAGITAASLALADAGIPMRDLVAACAVGKAQGQMIVDPDDIEDKNGEADMPLAYVTALDSISLLQMDGFLNEQEFEKAVGMAIEACKQVYELQKQALKRSYLSIPEKEESEAGAV